MQASNGVAVVERSPKTRGLVGQGMVVDPETGFLDVSERFGGFRAIQKKKIFELIEDNPHKSGIIAACKSVGVSPSTFWRHLDIDPQMRVHWERLKKFFAYSVEDVLAHCALDPKKTVDRIVYLKAYMPDKYNPQPQTTQNISISFDGSNLSNASQRREVIDAQVTPSSDVSTVMPSSVVS